jgi:1-acyl-sn-glycerol-3-phosphate acyltransferase
MAELKPTQFDAGLTVEFAGGGPQDSLPSDPRDDLRDQLPGLEPERQITDWGRSERVEALVDRTLYRFLYHYWFRVAVEGIENVPREGGALLVANHSGLIPSDMAMIAKAVREEHSARRPVHLLSDRRFTSIPGVGMIATKIGAVPAHPANLLRLLFDERQLVLAFPEGRSGPTKPLKDRYRLRRFDSGFVESAVRARVPIVPVAVVGAEESLPVLVRVGLLRRLTRLTSLPLTPMLPLPAKFQIRFLEAIATEELGAVPWEDKGLAYALGHEIRALIQENLLEMVAGRRSVWLG